MKFQKCFLFAPGGEFKTQKLTRAKTMLTKYFSETRYDPLTAEGYFAGSIVDREDQFKRILSLADSESDPVWIMPVRGGYGSVDIAPQFRNHRFVNKTVMSGFSDISVFLNMNRDDHNFFPVYGMNALASFASEISAVSRKYQSKIIRDFINFQYGRDVLSSLRVMNVGNTEGKITGGCLTVLLSSYGTELFHDFDGRILFLEDVDEPVYVIDRMLNQMFTIGLFDHIKGLIIGDFFGCKSQHGISFMDVFRKYFTKMTIPVVYNFPNGHGKKQVPILLNQKVALDASVNGKVNIRYL